MNGLKIGDVFTISPHPSVPKDLEGKYFRCEGFKNGNIQLSEPYWDKELTRVYELKK
jgi:hypothetical protein